MLDVHVVSHTHWDREWYLPAERFRQRLVALIDELLDDPPKADESFLLDGQTILLDDYLAVRPERRAELSQLLREGRLEAGPWFVLADELIPGGEALVRNLLEGRRVLRRLDAHAPPVLYCPDSFGHPAVLPAIAEGFGIPLVVLWRGYGSARWPRGDTAKWAAPNGDDVVLYHLPQSGYEFGANLPVEAAAAAARWDAMRKELAGRSTTGILLVLNGADHHARQENRSDAIAALARAAKGDKVAASSLRDFAKRFSSRSTNRLPVVQGELRDSYGFTWTLQGTFGTRAAEKRLNAIAERTLTREAEPWGALAARIIGANPGRRALTQAAWRTLLSAHPHDTLCGCSIDDVAEAMEQRVHAAQVQADGLRDDAVLTLVGHDTDAARAVPQKWRSQVVLRNAAPRVRSGVAIVELLEFLEHVPVGPGSARPATTHHAAGELPSIEGVPTWQALDQVVRHDRLEPRRAYPYDDLVRATRVAVWVDAMPGYGLQSHDLVPSATAPKPKLLSESVVSGPAEMRNGHLSVEIGERGAVTLTQLESGRRIADLISFEDSTDLGDLYTPSLRGEASTAAFVGAERLHAGPLRAEFLLHWRLTRAKPSAGDAPGSARKPPAATVSVRLILDARCPFLRVSVSGDNASTDHRLRVRFRSDVDEPQVFADAAFALVARPRLEIPPPERATEQAPPTGPLHRYLSLFGKRRGLTLFSDGLAEYEVAGDGSALVTLVRAVGELSRNDLPERPGHAGWPTATPAAQCLGVFAAEFGILPHGGRSGPVIAAIERTADDVLQPLTGTTLRSAVSALHNVAGAELEGSGLSFSAMKESDDGEWLVVRCVNLLAQPVHGRWRFGFPIREAHLARLDETPAKKMKITDGAVPFEAAGSAIVTILVR